MVWPFSSNEAESPKQTDSNSWDMVLKEVSMPAREIPRRKLVDAVNENCALEQFALFECQESWAIWKRFTLCQTFQAKYMDCMSAQRALLRQLGYGKQGNTPEQDEMIKWHADELYQQRLREQEKKKLVSQKE